MLHRHRADEDPAPLLAFARIVAWLKFDWQRFLIGFCAVWHLGLAVPLALAPFDQIYSAGTAPVFDLANRYVWAVMYLVAGIATVLLLRRQTVLVQLVTWFTVLPLGGSWLTAFALAVRNDEGNAIGVFVWLAVYGLFAVVAARVALEKR